MIETKNLRKIYTTEDVETTALNKVNLKVNEGEFVAVMGPSGCGKSTLLNILGLLDNPSDGEYLFLDTEVSKFSEKQRANLRKQNIGFVFQSFNLIDELTVYENVELPLLYLKMPAGERKKKVNDVLERMQLIPRKGHFPQQLSGGQQQRVAVARAIVGGPKLILADEPTAALDKDTGRHVVNLFQKLAQERDSTVLIVTHDNRILDIADRIIHLEDGRLQSFQDAVVANTRHMMKLLAGSNRKGDLKSHVEEMPQEQFVSLLEQVTTESRSFLESTELANNEAFESMLDQALDAFTRKIGALMDADRASLWLFDEQSGELWTKVAQDAGGEPVEIRIAKGSGIAGAVAASGEERLSTLADGIALEPSSLSRVLDVMRRNGWVETLTDPDDERARLVRMTDAGNALYAQACPLWRKAQTRARKLLGGGDAEVFAELADRSLSRRAP